MTPGFISCLLAASVAAFGATFAAAQDPHQLPADYLRVHAHPHSLQPAPRDQRLAPDRTQTPGIDSLASWNGSFHAIGFDNNGKLKKSWVYTMVGDRPERGGTTAFNAPVVPVSLDLLNPDGSVFLHYDPTPFILPALQSPVFENSTYDSSSTPTQFTDAVQRAEFWSIMAPDWHTRLNASLKPERVMQVPSGFYYYSLKHNGDCCLFVLIDNQEFLTLLFPPDPSDTVTPIGAAEHAGDITTHDISTFLFPNTYLYFGDPSACCALGFHTYDFEPGDNNNGNRDKLYIVNYSAYISPGLFKRFVDVTALAHEMSEIFNDPFTLSDGKHDLTPWWLSPNGSCGNFLETGDVIEGLPRAMFPVKLNGRTYHPQNEALLSWFAFESPSSAIDGAYSYPDETVLTALSPIELPGCQ